jgi:hypothetical protein
MALWMVFGALLGPVALLLLWIAPPGRCRMCQASVRGWLTTCEWCGSPVRVRSSRPVTADVAAIPSRPATPSPLTATSRPAKASAGAKAIAETATDARIRERLTSMTARRAAALAAASTEGPRRSTAADQSTRTVLATGSYVTGTMPLVAGSRYAIEVGSQALRILGPIDLDPAAVALTQDLPGIEATGFDERLVLTFGGGGRHGMVLVFTALEGAGAAGVAAAIVSAARSSRVAV